MWKNNSIIIIMISYCRKPNKNVLLVSIAQSKQDFCEALHKKTVVIDFYNSQRCGVDIANQMLRDYICHPTTVLVVFTFILDLPAVNARTILKYNKTNYDDTRRVFLRNWATSLIIPYIKKRKKNLKSVTISTINDVLAS